MPLLPIRIHPDPVLRVKCPRVDRFDNALRRLVTDMTDTMYAAPGIGLAAPQVGVELRLALVDASVGEEPGALVTLINPEIVEREGESTEEEGCLSIPGVAEKVTRAFRIRFRAQDLNGDPFELEADELLARAVQHEIDHLDGILFIDRLSGLRKQRVARQLKRQARRQEAVVL